MATSTNKTKHACPKSRAETQRLAEKAVDEKHAPMNADLAALRSMAPELELEVDRLSLFTLSTA